MLTKPVEVTALQLSPATIACWLEITVSEVSKKETTAPNPSASAQTTTQLPSSPLVTLEGTPVKAVSQSSPRKEQEPSSIVAVSS